MTLELVGSPIHFYHLIPNTFGILIPIVYLDFEKLLRTSHICETFPQIIIKHRCETYPVDGEIDNFLNLPNFDSKSNETAYSENKNDLLKFTKK